MKEFRHSRIIILYFSPLSQKLLNAISVRAKFSGSNCELWTSRKCFEHVKSTYRRFGQVEERTDKYGACRYFSCIFQVSSRTTRCSAKGQTVGERRLWQSIKNYCTNCCMFIRQSDSWTVEWTFISIEQLCCQLHSIKCLPLAPDAILLLYFSLYFNSYDSFIS